MGFRARISHPLGKELGCILEDMASDAEHALSLFSRDPHGSIHGLRTSMKKIRSVLALSAPELPSEATAQVLQTVKFLKDSYANTREEEVLRNLFLSLANKKTSGLVEILFGREPDAPMHPGSHILDAGKELRRQLADLPFWVLTEKNVFRSFSETVSKSGDLRDCCRKSEHAEDFHTWRKVIKRLATQSSVLKNRDPDLAGIPKLAGVVGCLLGDANDASNLQSRLQENENALVPKKFFKRLGSEIQSLRSAALKKSRRLYERLDLFQPDC